MAASYYVGRCGVRPGLCLVAVATMAVAGGQKRDRAPDPISTGSSIAAGPGSLGTAKGPTIPKVPFGNQPCQSLTAADEQALGMSGVQAKPDRAPATLPIDNVCSYVRGGRQAAQIGYMTDGDFQMNRNGNRSSTRQAPTDLPGAFYDQQGGLWFAKNGYDVVVSGPNAVKEPVARLVAGKL